jgi:hypothetical protein
MKPETKAVLSDPRLLQVREKHFALLTDLYACRPLSTVFVLQGKNGTSAADQHAEPERWLDEALDDLAARAEQSMDAAVFRPLVIQSEPYGVHFIDRMLGAHVYYHEGQWWADYLSTPIGQLRPPNLSTNETWSLATSHATAFLQRGVTVPLFSLPTIASPLNVLVNLYGQEVLTAFLLDPDAVLHDLRVINDLLCTLHRWYRGRIPRLQLQPVVAAGRCQPRSFGQICGCSTQLLSAAMYCDFIAPLDDELLSVYEHGGLIHLCGVHTQHIPVWRAMGSLRAIQVNDRAAEDLAIYFRELRDDQIIYLNPTPTMTVERAMRITGGHRLVLVADVTTPLPVGMPEPT